MKIECHKTPLFLFCVFCILGSPALAQQTQAASPFSNPPYDIARPQFSIKAGPSQTADIQQWLNAAGAKVTWIDVNGNLHGGGPVTLNFPFSVTGADIQSQNVGSFPGSNFAAGWFNVNYTQPTPLAFESLQPLVVSASAMSGGFNWSNGGIPNKTGYEPVEIFLQGAAQGEKIGLGITQDCWGLGDCIPLSLTNYTGAGGNAQGDEQAAIFTANNLEQACEPTGVLPANIVTGSATPPTTTLTSPTCFDSSQGANPTWGVGRTLIDFTLGTTGTISLIGTVNTNNLTPYSIAGLTASTVAGTLGAAVTIPTGQTSVSQTISTATFLIGGYANVVNGPVYVGDPAGGWVGYVTAHGASSFTATFYSPLTSGAVFGQGGTLTGRWLENTALRSTNSSVQPTASGIANGQTTPVGTIVGTLLSGLPVIYNDTTHAYVASTSVGTAITRNPAACGLTGTVNTSGAAVTWVSGEPFSALSTGQPIIINSVGYTINSVSSPTSLTLSSTAGSQSGVAFTLECSYAAYPMSVIQSVNAVADANGVLQPSNTLTIAPVSVQWNSGDTVDSPHYQHANDVGIFNNEHYTFSPQGNSTGTLFISSKGQIDGSAMVEILNNERASNYPGLGFLPEPPPMIQAIGPFLNSVYTWAPMASLLDVYTCNSNMPGNADTCATAPDYGVFSGKDASGSSADGFYFSPSANTGYFYTGGGTYKQTLPQATGTIALTGGTNPLPGYMVGSCSGTATASQTIWMFPIGEFSALTCTVTGASPPGNGLGIPIVSNGTVHIVAFKVTGGSTTTNNVPFHIWIGGVDQGVACTIPGGSGASNNCVNTSLNIAVTSSAAVAVSFNTGGGETLADVGVSLAVR
ncbi:MAG: hypothetical protein WB780_20315 [Candidatus Acidiferrales bacterium]